MKTKEKYCNLIFSEEDYNLLKEKAKLNGLKPTTYSKMKVIQSLND